jgi:glycosyltransferase involved in cell wall biosynthesis
MNGLFSLPDEMTGPEQKQVCEPGIRISVVIPSYNSEHTIEKCLDSILGQSFRGDYEIILVDSSTDKTPLIVSSKYPNVNLIHLDEKTDPGTARNIGVGKTRGEIIAFIDSDCVADRDWLVKIQDAHNSAYNAIGGSVRNGNDKENLVAWAGYISEFREFVPEQSRREVTHIPTCNISYKSDIFRSFGLFKGEYYPQEDLVFNHTLSLRGEKILFDPAIQVYHTHRTKMKDYLRHQKKIGNITSRVLKLINLEGSFIPRHPFLAPFILPFLPMVKFARTVSVFIKLQPSVIIKQPAVLFIFAAGLLFWLFGFSQGIYDRASK